MQTLTVQIERLKPMRVAVRAVTSASPENDSMQALIDWARPQGLLNGAARMFGYDNCQPEPNHTYTSWLTVGADVKPSDDIHIIQFPGGLFAVTELQGVEQIAPAWHQLADWLKTTEYTYGGQPGLEECLDALRDVPPDQMRFKLYLSLKK